MQIDQTGHRMYCILMDNEQETIISQWANDCHIDNEQVIEEWLSKIIEIHKILHPAATTLKEEIRKILLEKESDNA